MSKLARKNLGSYWFVLGDNLFYRTSNKTSLVGLIKYILSKLHEYQVCHFEQLCQAATIHNTV